MRNKVLFILSIVLGLLWLLISLAPKRPWPGRNAVYNVTPFSSLTSLTPLTSPLPPLPPLPPSKRLRVRFVNTNMIPLGHPIEKKAKLAIQHGVFKDVDVVLFQEVFYRPWWLGIDPLKALAKRAPHVHLVRPSHTLPAFTYTSSGLACGALPPWTVKCVGFEPFAKCGPIDGMSQKGVAVFELSDGQTTLRLATTHLQASYANCLKDRDNQARVKQFKQAVNFAKACDALVLGGDINTSDVLPLDQMSQWVEDRGGTKLVDDEACSGRAILKSAHGWRTDPSVGARLDHGWILDASRCKQVSQMRTNEAVTRDWSDHAALDVLLAVQ